MTLWTASLALDHPNLNEFLMYASQHAGMTFASPGPGTAPHLLGEMLKTPTHIDIVHVPYKGEALAGEAPAAASCAS
jgi:tripartite-type tricarboxylate transporter receptor subunit TctC